MPTDPQETLAILRHNTGFDDPTIWIDYARSHGFKRVKAVAITRCPDCAAEPDCSRGQYVYYSTLIHLLQCARCGLIWANAHIDPELVRSHFEVAYKDDAYFRDSRRAIFEHLAAVIDDLAPEAARVLDVGGARGDLMHQAARRRPDLHVTVQDISEAATDAAEERFGFATLRGDARLLASHAEQYDVAVLSDVLYYEPDLRLLWSALSRLVRPGGSIVIRIPNKFPLVRIGQRWFELVRTARRQLLQTRVAFHNPEHIFIFRQRYLRARLRAIGFTGVAVAPSPVLSTSMPGAARSAYFQLARAVSRLSPGGLVLTPSMLVVGRSKRPVDPVQEEPPTR